MLTTTYNLFNIVSFSSDAALKNLFGEINLAGED